MEAKYEKTGEVVVVELNGRLDFESSDHFRRQCLDRLFREKVVVDMKRLNFVGSLGLQDFVDTMDHMAKKSAPGLKICGMSSEFRRLFEASGLANIQFFDSRESALSSFRNSVPAATSALPPIEP